MPGDLMVEKKSPQKKKVPVELQIIKLNDLNPDPDNPRVALSGEHPQYQKIKSSIEGSGFVDPIIFDSKTRELIGGHQRLKILQEGGVVDLYVLMLGGISWAFPSMDVPELTPTRRKQLNLALNKAVGDWDYGKLSEVFTHLKEDPDFDPNLTGFDPFEISACTDDIDPNLSFNTGDSPDEIEGTTINVQGVVLNKGFVCLVAFKKEEDAQKFLEWLGISDTKFKGHTKMVRGDNLAPEKRGC